MYGLLDDLYGLPLKVQIMLELKLIINTFNAGQTGVQCWRMLCIPLIST